VVAQVNKAAGTISLTQTLPAKPTAVSDLPTATADYQASPALINKATVGAVVQVTVQQINGKPAVTTLGGFSAPPSATASSTPTPTSPLVSNPARLTPAGVP
jgi:hypothetical protein